MKLGKRLCAWLLCAAMVMGFVPGPAQADSNSETNNTEVWSGSKAISWDDGTSWETGNIFSSISDGSTIQIVTNITGTIDDDTVKCDVAYQNGGSWTNLATTNSNGTISYSVAPDTRASIQTNGLRIQGGNFTVSKIRICNNNNVVWSGNENISWNPEVVTGTQYELTGIFTGLAVGDIIRVSTTKTEGYNDDPQYVVTYKAGSGWEWTDLNKSVSDNGVISCTVESEQIATEIAERGLIFRGQGWTAKQITVDKVVWSEAKLFTRAQFETKGDSQPDTDENMFNNLKQGDIITVSTTKTEGYNGEPRYVVTYKAGDNGSWTDLTKTVDNDVISFTVADETIVADIKAHGLVFRGQGYTITKITVTTPAAEPSEPAEPAASTVSKLWTFDNSKDGWGITWSDAWVDDTNYTYDNGAIKFSLSKPGSGTWSQTASALNSSNACGVPGLGPVAVDVICKTDDIGLLNDMNINVKYNYDNKSRECGWTNFSSVGSNSWTQIGTTDFSYRTVTVSLDKLTIWSNDVTDEQKNSFNANTNWGDGGLQISFASNSYSSSSEKGSVGLWLDNITIGTVNNRPATPDAPVAAEASETVDIGNTQGWTESGSWGESNVSLGTMSQSNKLQVKFQLENSVDQWKTLQLVHTAAAAPAENTTISMKVYYAADEMPVANNSLLIKAFYRYNDGSKDVTTTETENCKHTLSTSTDANGTELKLKVSGCPTDKAGGYFILQFTSANGTNDICTLYIDDIHIAETTDSGQGGQGSGEGGQGGGETSTHTITLKAYDGDAYAANFTNNAFDPGGTEGSDCRSYTYADGQSTTVTVNYVVWGNKYLQKIVVDGVKQTVTGQNQTFTFNDSANHTITAYYKYSETKLSAGDIAIDPPWRFDSGTEGWSRGYDWNYGATDTAFAYDSTNQSLTLTGVDYTQQNDDSHQTDAGKLSVGFDATDPFTLAEGTNCLKLKLGYSFSDAAKDLTVKVTLKSPGNTEVVKEAARLVSVSDSGSSEVSVLFPALKANTEIESVTLDIYSATYKGNIWIDDVSFANVDTCKVTLSTDNGKWLNIFQVNGQPISVDNSEAETEVMVEKNSTVTVTVARCPNDEYWLTALRVDGFKQTVTEQKNQTVTLRASVDHTITAYYEYSKTPITPEEPAVDKTEITTTSTDTGTSTATVSDSVATTVTNALTEHKAAGITATDADNVALEAAVVNALATNESDKGDDGIVAVIATKTAVIEAPAAMFENAKDGNDAIAVTLKTERKEEDAYAGGITIAAAAAASGETGTVKGAVDVSLVNTSSTEEIKVDLGESGAKPITIKTKIEKSLYKNQLRVGYIKEDKLVFDDTVRLTAYDKKSGEMAFTTTHFTTFVVVSGNEFVWNFNSGLDGWSFGWANDYDGQEKGRSYTDEQKAKMVSLSGGALKLSLDYTKTPSKENPWPSFTVQYYGETIPLSGKNYLSMDVYYDAAKLGGSTLLFAVGAGDNLITADNAQLNTYAATDATINGEKMKKTRVLIGFNSDVAADNNSMNIAIVNTSGTYKGNVYLDNITLGAASNFITTTVNEDYRGTFIPGGRVPMLGDSTTIYVVQKGSDQRIAKLTLDGKTVSDASHKTTYQFTYENDALNHSLYAEFEWFDANGSAGLVVSSGEVFRAELTNPVAAVGEKLVQPEAEVKNGKLATVISEKEISDIIAEVETAEKSEKTDVITIIPYVKDRKTEVTRTEVALPAASVSELAEKTGAALRVETVVAAITIPNESLKEIGSEGGIIAVAAERAEEYMELSVTANGSRLTDIRGGISASVPMECGPGTVAMLAEDELRTRSELVNRSAGHGSEADPAEKDNPTESVEGKPLLYSAANSQGTAMTVLLPGSARIRFVHQAKRFTDVPEVSWASGAVDFVSSHRIFGGYDDGAFYPNSVMNRAMLVQVLYNMSERPAAEHGNVFADVPSGAWFADAVNWASGTRVVRGYGDGTFAPGATITRQDAVVILYRYAGEPECEDTDLSRFEDEDRIGTYARKAIQWAVSRRLLNGVSASQLAPGAELTRYQAAKLLMNYVQDRVG